MGVPAFFRWLSRKYSSIVLDCIEETTKEINGETIPIDTSKPNPNDIEFDNLYLDMNGIIHPCSHPEDRPAPKNEKEIMIAIFEAIDRLFAIVRPRRLLYMAIDGVAPRAKMNQQRSRRFRASKEGVETAITKDRIKAELRANGALLKDDPTVEKFDSNCITPGTGFMHRLAKCLRFYVIERLNTDPGWRNIEVILSDANVPGEGEHKIMDYIRRQRGQPNHDPNTHHCICGADADLIMLGLATHEPNFTIIREEFKPNQPRPCGICSQYGHEMAECKGLPKEKEGEHDELNTMPPGCGTNYIFIRLCVIREYIELEMQMPNLPFNYDFENIIDDWVMMCFFVGNDFLPHLPSLEIREGAIDKLVSLYKDMVYQTKGYLTKNGLVRLDRVEMIMKGIGKIEDQIFQKRRQSDVSFRAREKAKRQRTSTHSGPRFVTEGQFAPVPLGPGHSAPAPLSNVKEAAKEMRTKEVDNKSAATALRAALKGGNSSEEPPVQLKRKLENSDDEPEDDVRLWEVGWKERYFRSKFNVPMNDYEFRRKVVRSYVEGLCWVLAYYYQGCASWKWFFPFHYAPFASDFIDIADLPNTFPTTTKPKNPLEQLMCVFPAASGQFLPESWRDLMSNPDSPIIDFYPEDFKIDLNGKKYAWQGVALLPFVDEDRMMKALDQVYPDLTEEERMRNSLGNDYLFVGKSHPLHTFFSAVYEDGSAPDEMDDALDIDPSLAHGMTGKVWRDRFCDPKQRFYPAPLPVLEDITHNTVLSMAFKDPLYPEGHVFEAKLLPGAKFPPRTVKPSDLKGRGGGNWRPRIGFNANRNTRAQLDQSGHRHLRHHTPHQEYPYNAGPRFQSPPQGGAPWAHHQSIPHHYNATNSHRGSNYGNYGGGNYGNRGGGNYGNHGGSNYGNRGGSNYGNHGGSNYGNNRNDNYRPPHPQDPYCYDRPRGRGSNNRGGARGGGSFSKYGVY